MRVSAFLATAAALVSGCSFPDFVADLDDSTDTSVQESAPTDSATGDTCRSPCGCGGADSGVVDAAKDSIDGDATTDAAASDVVVTDGSLGASCGPCKTGTIACAGGALACTVGDDRASAVDESYAAVSISPRRLSHLSEIAVAYPLHRKSTPFSFTFSASREAYACVPTTTLPNPDVACDRCTPTGTGFFICTVSKPKDGQLTLKVMQGQPNDPAASTLATVSAPLLSLPMAGTGTSPTTLVFPIDPSMAPLSIATPIFVDISIDSTAWTLVLDSGRAKIEPPPADVALWSHNLTPPTPWVIEIGGGAPPAGAKFLPIHSLTVRGCF